MRLITISLFALTAVLLSGCPSGDEGGKKGGARAFPVQVEEIKGTKVEYSVSAVGSVNAFEEVLVTARVQGVVEKVLFREGDTVSEETTLVEIEPARFEYQHQAAIAAHQRAEAELKEAREGLERREKPTGERPGIFSKEEIEAWRTKVSVAQANERERAAQLQQAALDLQHSKPTAPMAGVIQERLVQTGQWVQPGTVIARLLRRDPMLLRFSVSEDEARFLAHDMEARFTVRGASKEYRADIIHVAASADRITRMVQVTAEVHEEGSEELTPGAFARVTVPVGGRENAPTVPETAVRPSEKGFLVFVVKDGKAQQRVIEIGLRTPDGRIEVRNGLETGEIVVVRGAEALRPGVDVAISSEVPGAPEARP